MPVDNDATCTSSLARGVAKFPYLNSGWQLACLQGS
jgi:hypothetical protein